MEKHRITLLAIIPIMLIATTSLSTIATAQDRKYLSPISVVPARAGKLLYIAEATANQIAVFDVVLEEVTKIFDVAENPIGLAISPDGDELYVTSAQPAGEVQIIQLRCLPVVRSIAVGHTPVAVVAHPNGKTLYVCNQFSNNVGVIDLKAREQVAAIPVTRQPVAAAITPDGKYLYVTNLLPAGPASTAYTAAVVSIIDTAAQKLVDNIELPDGSINLRGITISPDGKYAYVTHVLARYQWPVTFLELKWVNTNAMTVIDVSARKYVNTVLLDDVDLGAANPDGVACTADGKYIVVAHAGSYELSVIDRPALHSRLLCAESPRDFVCPSHSTFGTKRSDPAYTAKDTPNDFTFLTGIRRRLKLTGIGPRGLALVGTKAFAAEYFTDSISTVDIDPNASTTAKSIPLGEKREMTDTRAGEIFFNDASHTLEQWHSCATCHSSDARTCALNWDLLNDGIANPKNAKSLLHTHETPPSMATGVRPNAERAVRSGIIYTQFAYPHPEKMNALNTYLKSLKPVPSPYLVDGQLSPAAKNGERLFEESACSNCHSGPLYTGLQKHDVGTAGDMDEDPEFDTPSLVEVWRTAPYLHDGRAATIEEVLTKYNKNDTHGQTSHLTEKQIADLAEYVLTR